MITPVEILMVLRKRAQRLREAANKSTPIEGDRGRQINLKIAEELGRLANQIEKMI